MSNDAETSHIKLYAQIERGCDILVRDRHSFPSV
eukprot:SAG31_NODE_24550_length_479_cov_0.781579_2_plen_33_part_01